MQGTPHVTGLPGRRNIPGWCAGDIGTRLWVSDVEFLVSHFGFRVSDFEFRVSGHVTGRVALSSNRFAACPLPPIGLASSPGIAQERPREVREQGSEQLPF